MSSTGVDRWVLFNDEQVYAMAEGWQEILNDCLGSKAYPSVLVYEQMSEQEEVQLQPHEAKDALTSQQVSEWIAQAEQ